jgi:hypothetical protein
MPRRRPQLLLLAAAFLYAAAASGSDAAGVTQEGSVELQVPRAAGADEAIWLQIRTGQLPPGAKVRILGEDGEAIAAIAPFGASRVQGPVSSTVSLPATAVKSSSVRLRLEVEEPGAAARAPISGEIESVELVYVPTN